MRRSLLIPLGHRLLVSEHHTSDRVPQRQRTPVCLRKGTSGAAPGTAGGERPGGPHGLAGPVRGQVRRRDHGSSQSQTRRPSFPPNSWPTEARKLFYDI